MENIKVAVRSRPFSKREIELNQQQSVVEIVDDNKICIKNYMKDGKIMTKTFQFDYCFDSTNRVNKSLYATQEKVYECLGLDALENLISGYNACIFAYGQTGSGKSYTIMGDQADKGIIPRLCEDLFKKLDANKSDELTFKTEVSYMEIYNEKLKDLLDPKCSNQNLKVREHQLLGIYVDGLTQLAVKSYEDIEIILNEGNKLRTVAATNMNAESSRSHAVFCIKIIQNMFDKQTNMNGEKVGKLSIIDLAGSEKVSKTGTEGDRLKEGCNINKSLHTLGLVISALADNSSKKSSKPKHIPYRDSTLTWLLKDSLGGNSKTIMISTISPSIDNYEETLSTLRYSDRAKCIINNAVINEDPNAKIIRNLREEVEMLRRELEKAKEKLNMDTLKDRLCESEKLYQEISKPWDKKLAETEEWREKLHNMGISVQSSGIKVENDKYFLVNMNPNQSSNEYLVYYLKEVTLVGRPDSKIKQDIQLTGPGISLEHCVITCKNNQVYISPTRESNKILINGEPIRGERCLYNADRISIGLNLFRLNCPIVNNISDLSSPESSSDYRLNQDEIRLSSGQFFSSSTTTSSLDENELDDDLSSRYDTISIKNSSSSNCLSSLNRFSLVDSNENLSFGKRLEKLRENLLNVNQLVNEANALLKDLNKPFKFEVTLKIPESNLTPCKKDESLLVEPMIIVKYSNFESTLIDMDIFENLMIKLKDHKLNGENNSNRSDLNKLFDFESNNELIGVANLFLDPLIYIIEASKKSQTEFKSTKYEHELSILSTLGELNGKLKVALEICTMNSDYESNELKEKSIRTSVLPYSSVIKFKLTIIEATDLKTNRINNIFCKYGFWNNGNVTIMPMQVRYSSPLNGNIKSRNNLDSLKVVYNHNIEYSIEINEEFLDYLHKCGYSLPIALLYNKHVSPEQQSLFFDDSKYLTVDDTNFRRKRLIDSWNEVSKSLELFVEIFELSKEGSWKSVEVKQHSFNKTGGIYQLRHGQSKQIAVRINSANKSSMMYHNGSQFNYDPIAIDKMTIGSVHGQILYDQSDLDSYQDEDLTRLKEKCKEIFKRRKQYLLSELDLAQKHQSSQDSERENCLFRELAAVGEELTEIDAPEANSDIPGSVIEWKPSIGMEHHVPILFLDLNDEFLPNSEQPASTWNDQNCENEDLETFESEGNYLKRRFMKKSKSKTVNFSEDSFLENENVNSFLELDLFKSEYDHQIESEIIEARANWDSTRHQSIHLNQTTPTDRQIYLILKVYLKFKRRELILSKQDSLKYITVVLRKRIAVNIYIPSLMTSTGIGIVNFRRFLSGEAAHNKSFNQKNLITNINQTGLTYRIILQIPRKLKELERRESLAHEAVKKAIQDKPNMMMNYLEAFIRSLESIDILLRQERMDQVLKFKSIIKIKSDLINFYLLVKQRVLNSSRFRKSLSNIDPLSLPISNQNAVFTRHFSQTNTEDENLEKKTSSLFEKKSKDLSPEDQVDNENSKNILQDNSQDISISIANSEEDDQSNRSSLIKNDDIAKSNLSISSDKTSSSMIQTKNEEENGDEMTPSWLQEGAYVMVSSNSVMNKPGYIRFIGQTKFAQGIWIGVELVDSFGRNDGSLNGHRYFHCEKSKGVFVKSDKLKLINNNN